MKSWLYVYNTIIHIMSKHIILYFYSHLNYSIYLLGNREISFTSVLDPICVKLMCTTFPVDSLKLNPSSPSLEELPPPLVTSLPSYMIWCEQAMSVFYESTGKPSQYGSYC